MFGRIEPSADQRTWAKTIFAMYVALVEEGFTEQQALVIVGQLLIAANGGDQ